MGYIEYVQNWYLPPQKKEFSGAANRPILTVKLKLKPIKIYFRQFWKIIFRFMDNLWPIFQTKISYFQRF